MLYLHQRLTGGRYGLIDIGEPDGSGLAVIDHKGAHGGVFPSLVEVPEHSARQQIECANAALLSSWNPTQDRDSDQTRENQSVDDLCQRGSRRVEPCARPTGQDYRPDPAALQAAYAPPGDGGHRPDQGRRTPPDFLLSEALTRSRAPLTFNASYSVRHI
ncbi:hypothetical protein TPA0906_58060 [Streptomyces olivaceus]|nr:hypothetical protein TPA0906_58060 [Streptomyces olivaceus]